MKREGPRNLAQCRTVRSRPGKKLPCSTTPPLQRTTSQHMVIRNPPGLYSTAHIIRVERTLQTSECESCQRWRRSGLHGGSSCHVSNRTGITSQRPSPFPHPHAPHTPLELTLTNRQVIHGFGHDSGHGLHSTVPYQHLWNLPHSKWKCPSACPCPCPTAWFR